MGKTRSLGLLHRTEKGTSTMKKTDSTITPKTMQMDGSLQLVECRSSSINKEMGAENTYSITEIRHFNHRN